MKPLVIYHDNCADGFGAAFAAWLKLGDDAEYLPCQYGTDISVDENVIQFEGREIYILDFSFTKDIMSLLFGYAKRVVWLDHHKTAFEMWRGEYYPGIKYKQPLVDSASYRADNPEELHTIVLDDSKSGAMIAWEYFHPDKEVPMLIKHIDDYDRWQFRINGTKEFIKALWSYAPWKFAEWNHILSWGQVEVDRMKDEGAAILRAHDQNVQAVVKSAARGCVITIGKYDQTDADMEVISFRGLAANCPPHLASDVGHQLANESGTYGLLWYVGKEGLTAKCSLRSNGDYDVSAIAKAFGGGGHKNAAGFEVLLTTLLNWIS